MKVSTQEIKGAQRSPAGHNSPVASVSLLSVPIAQNQDLEPGGQKVTAKASVTLGVGSASSANLPPSLQWIIAPGL